MNKTLSNKALQDAAISLGIELAAIRAVDHVESRGAGFTSDGHVKVLFERHKFSQFTKRRFDQTHPDLSNPKAGGYGREAVQYSRFSRAFGLDPTAAMRATSWGRYQIMGFNHEAAGFDTVDAFVDAMKISEDEHLKAFVNVIKAWGLTPELQKHQWASFARQYNGVDYKKNAYDTKLAAAYERFKNEPLVTEPVTEDLKAESRSEAPVEPEVKAQEPEPPAAPQAPKPEVTPVEAPPTSITTKVAAGVSAIAPVLTAAGIKIGGIELSTAGVIALSAVIIVGMVIGAWIWNQSQERRERRQRLTMEHLASDTKGNIVAAGTKV